MNVNGARFHLLLGVSDWEACTTTGAQPQPLRLPWAQKANDDTIPWFDEDSGRLTLRALDEPIPATPGEPVFTPADHRDAAADRNGNLYIVSDDRHGLLVRSAGDNRVTTFWPPRPGRAPWPAPVFGDAAPPPAEPRVLSGLAVTSGDFLVAGFISEEASGLLRFDLIGGGAPERIAFPPGIAPASLAPSCDGGLWMLDVVEKRLLKLNRELRFESTPVEGEAQAFAPEGEDPANCVIDTPVTIDASQAYAPVAVATLCDGSVLLLDARVIEPARVWILDPAAPQLRLLTELEFAATCFTVAGKPEAPVLLLADASGNQARRVALALENALWEAEVLPDTLPLRRFGGRSLVTIKDEVYYDSGATDPLWVPVVEVRHRRFAPEASFLTPIYDGAEPQCVWDRLRIDGCIPAGTQVRIEARAADDPASFATATASAWVPQPALMLSPSGPELPTGRALARITTDAAAGRGSWGLLLQNLTGRYAQLRIVLTGDERVTPKLRALRLWYPRFSYVERFLPGVYREEPTSASFLERFLANFEGLNTAIEDRIATMEALFDPRAAPVEMLEWLASWYEVALDPSWDERRRRLFIAHASAFFGWRGTIRGLQLALKLALDPDIAEEDFDLEAPQCISPRAIRIVEAYGARTRGRSFATTGVARAPGIHSLAEDWMPQEGAAGLWARWPVTPHPAGRFPLFARPGEESNWAETVQKQFGFVPSLGAGERARWQAFQQAIGSASPLADLPGTASEDWLRYVALPSYDRRAWQAYLRTRYRSIERLQRAHEIDWEDFALIPLPDYLPATPAATRDWLMFEGHALPIDRAAHRFSVLLPRIRVDSDPGAEAERLALARRIIGLEKPAHTVFDVRFYWAMNRVGEARLGLDSAIGQGSRAPELIPGAVLGRAYVGAAFVGGPGDPPGGRELVAC